MNNDDNDFGFTADPNLVFSSNPTDHVVELKKELLHIFNGFLKEPDKELVRWPNRKQQVESLIERINQFLV